MEPILVFINEWTDILTNWGILTALKSIAPILSWLFIPVLIGLFGWWQWRSKRDNESIIVSLNAPARDEGNNCITKSLRMFTILNLHLRDVIENSHARKILLRAGKKTTTDNPFIFLGKDKISILNFVLNDLSALYAEGFTAKEIGLPVIEKEFIIALTREKYAGMRWETTRVMLVEKKWLVETDFTYNDPAEWDLKEPHHHLRLETLQKMKMDFHEGENKYCLTMRIAIKK